MAKSSLNPPNYDDDVAISDDNNNPFADGPNNRSDDNDRVIEMIEFDQERNRHYTSLKDVLSSAPPPPAPASPAAANGGSWKEIPIRDPLVQHAAWAYLQPMSSARRDDGGPRWMTAVGKRCCECFNDVVMVLFKSFFFSSKGD